MITAKDLTKEAPRSLCQRVKGYAVLARMADKARATLNGTMREYHFNCPLDNMLFGFKGVQAEDVKSLLASGATDEQVAAWLDQNGIPKRPRKSKPGPIPSKQSSHIKIPKTGIGLFRNVPALVLIRSKAGCAIIWTRTIDLASQNNRLNGNGGHHRSRPRFMPMITILGSQRGHHLR